MWFEKLTGFVEESANQVRKHLRIEGDELVSTVNGNRFLYGLLETPKLSELRARVNDLKVPLGKMSLQECVADVQELHTKIENKGAFFQVASQFNLLEMVSPEINPGAGVNRYALDFTQGPACAIAAGAGTIYRNYFVELNGDIGQSQNNQIDALSDVGKLLGNESAHLWQMTNGYALATEAGLKIISMKLGVANEQEIDQIRENLRIGIQWNTEVTLNKVSAGNTPQTVTQSYCSALPVAYSQHSSKLWERFAQVILEASYEATICAAIINYSKTGNPHVYLTLLGGGAFANEESWIMNALDRALLKYKQFNLQVFIVSYRSTNPTVKDLVDKFQI